VLLYPPRAQCSSSAARCCGAPRVASTLSSDRHGDRRATRAVARKRKRKRKGRRAAPGTTLQTPAGKDLVHDAQQHAADQGREADRPRQVSVHHWPTGNKILLGTKVYFTPRLFRHQAPKAMLNVSWQCTGCLCSAAARGRAADAASSPRWRAPSDPFAAPPALRFPVSPVLRPHPVGCGGDGEAQGTKAQPAVRCASPSHRIFRAMRFPVAPDPVGCCARRRLCL
jgi:hypothetical protein